MSNYGSSELLKWSILLGNTDFHSALYMWRHLLVYPLIPLITLPALGLSHTVKMLWSQLVWYGPGKPGWQTGAWPHEYWPSTWRLILMWPVLIGWLGYPPTTPGLSVSFLVTVEKTTSPKSSYHAIRTWDSSWRLLIKLLKVVIIVICP